MTRIGAVYGGSSAHHRSLTEPKYARHVSELLYLPDLPGRDLRDLDAVVVPCRLHRRLLAETRPALEALLEAGGVVVLFGDQPEPVLPGIRWESRPTNFWWWLDPDASSGLVAADPGHGLFRHLALEDATWHQHGVFDPPEGAEIPVTTEDGAAVLYVDRVTTPGTLVVTSLDPLYHYGSYFMPATERFLDGFYPWLIEDLLGARAVRD